MKYQNLSLIAGIIALSLTATPITAYAQNTTSLPTIIAQEIEESEEDVYKKLGLTEEQKTEIKQICSNTKAEINKILTPEQQQQLNTKEQNCLGRDGRGELASLNLSSDQKTKIKQILESEKAKIEEVLTDEQEAKLQQLQQERTRNSPRRQRRRR
jgi:protein CpxP